MVVSDWTQAIERNTASFLLALSRPGGAAERNDGRLQWTIGGSPIDYHNAVVVLALRPTRLTKPSARSLMNFGPATSPAHGIWGHPWRLPISATACCGRASSMR